MIGLRPTFFDSPYFVDDIEKPYLLPGAPPEVVQEFNEYFDLVKEFSDTGMRPAPK